MEDKCDHGSSITYHMKLKIVNINSKSDINFQVALKRNSTKIVWNETCLYSYTKNYEHIMKTCFVSLAVYTSFFVVLFAHIISSHAAVYHAGTAKILLAMILWFYMLKKWHSGVCSVCAKWFYVFTSRESEYLPVRGEGWR